MARSAFARTSIMITWNLSIDGVLQYEKAIKNITASRVPPYLAAFLIEATTRPASTTAARYTERVPRTLSSSRFHPRDIPATSTAVVSLPVHATVAGTSWSNKCYQCAAFAPPPKRASRAEWTMSGLVVETAPRRCNHLTRAPIARQATCRNPESLNSARVAASNAIPVVRPGKPRYRGPRCRCVKLFRYTEDSPKGAKSWSETSETWTGWLMRVNGSLRSNERVYRDTPRDSANNSGSGDVTDDLTRWYLDGVPFKRYTMNGNDTRIRLNVSDICLLRHVLANWASRGFAGSNQRSSDLRGRLRGSSRGKLSISRDASISSSRQGDQAWGLKTDKEERRR